MTDHDVAAFVDVLAESAGPAGRWIHFGLTSSDVLDTALALQLRAAGDVIVPAARELVAALAGGLASTATRSASGARTASTPSRRPSASSWRGWPWRRTAMRTGWSAPLTRLRWARCRGRSGPTRQPARNSKRACWAAWDWPASRSPPRSSPATATPSCCRRSRWPARAWSAWPPRSATSSAPRCSRSQSPSAPGARRAARPCPTSATRSSPSASPGWPGSCAATARRGSRTSRCGTSATSPTRAPSG